MSGMDRKTDEFSARSDDGREFKILEFTEFDDTTIEGVEDSTANFVAAVTRYATEEGHDVVRIEEGVFDIPAIGARVKRVGQ